MMTGLEKRRRAPDIRSMGINLIAAGVVVSIVEGQQKWAPGAVIVAAGVACYYWGLSWE